MRELSLVVARLLFVAVHGLLIAVASLCGTQALGMRSSVVAARGLSSCHTWALGRVGFSSCGLRDLERRLSGCGAWA